MSDTGNEKESWFDEERVAKDVEFLLRETTKGFPPYLIAAAVFWQCDSTIEARNTLSVIVSKVVGKLLKEGLIEKRHGRYYPVRKEEKE